jgi:hypothetical protein
MALITRQTGVLDIATSRGWSDCITARSGLFRRNGLTGTGDSLPLRARGPSGSHGLSALLSILQSLLPVQVIQRLRLPPSYPQGTALDNSLALASLRSRLGPVAGGIVDKRAVRAMRADQRAKLPKPREEFLHCMLREIILDTSDKK